jgi:hypothetical protein
MTLDDAFLLITTDPRTLLDSAFLNISGGDQASKSGYGLFAIGKPDSLQGFFTRSGSATPIPGFEVRLLQGQQTAQPKFTSGSIEWRTFPACYIAMKKMGAGPGNAPTGTYYSLSPTGGPDICITSQLSGCTFALGSQTPDSSCLVCHIQPAGPLVAAQPVMTLQATQLFGQAPTASVQKGVDYAEKANVIGQRISGKWFFFMQRFSNILTQVIEPVVDVA